MTGPRRVLVLTNQISADQSAVWDEVDASGSWEVHLCGPEPRSELDAFVPSATRPSVRHVHRIQPKDLGRGRGHLWWVMPGLGRLIADVRPDVIHVNSEPWGLLVSQALRHHGVVVAHGAETRYTWGSPVEQAVRRAVVRRNLRRLSGFASWNEAGVVLARENGLPAAAPTTVVPAITAADSGVAPAPVHGPELVVGFVGRLLPEKGLSVLLDACARLVQEGRAVRLTVVGDGPQAALLQAQLPFDLDYRGQLGNVQTRAAMGECDVLAIPSRTAPHWEEQFGRVVVEAFAGGVPVISSDAGALPEVVADAGGVVPEGDPVALAAALDRFTDRAHRAERAAAGRERYDRHYSPPVLAGSLRQFWERACRART